MTPVIGNNDFSGGLNVRDAAHLLVANEGDIVEGIDIKFRTVKTFPGDIRELIDITTYPEVDDECAVPIPGSGGGVLGPILGRWRYYHGNGMTRLNDSWARVWGLNHIEYWNPTTQRWTQLGGTAGWTLSDDYKPWATQFQDRMYILHGNLAIDSWGKYFWSNGAGDFASGDIPVPPPCVIGAVVFTAAPGLNDMTQGGAFTGIESRNFRVQIERNPIGPVIFYGTGLNDMTNGGAYVGAIERRYLVEIDAVVLPAGPDTFRWSDDGGINWTNGVVITGAAQVLSNGVTITFAAIFGHTLGDYWGFECGPTDAIRWSKDGGGSWDASLVPITAGVDINLTEGITVQFAAAVGHTVTNHWDFTITCSGLHNLRPTIAVPYKNRLYICDQTNEPYRVRFSGVNLPAEFDPPEGGYVGIGEDRGDPIISMIVHKDNLFVLKRSSVWRYWRDYYDNEYMEQVHGAAGCIAPQTACAYKDAIYYASDEGMIALYGADSDCITHNIMREVTPDPDYLWAMQAVVTAGGPEGGRLWVTYLTDKEIVQDEDEQGGPLGDPYLVWHTEAWVADIRRPNIINPRWVKLPYYRLTNFAMPPHSNNYRGVDWQNLHFDAQQPDMNDWNPDPDVTPDPLYPPGILGGPRFYSYRWNCGWDRDQVPPYEDLCGCPVYAGNDGIGYRMTFATPRYLPAGNMRRIQWAELRLDYAIWRSADHKGMDGAWARIQIEGHWLELNNPIMLDPTWWPIDGQPDDMVVGGEAHKSYTLQNRANAKGRSLKMEWHIVGTSNRARSSHEIVFKFWGCEYIVPEDKFNPED